LIDFVQDFEAELGELLWENFTCKLLGFEDLAT